MRSSHQARHLTRRLVLSGSAAMSAGLSGCASLVPRNGIADAIVQRKAVIAGLPGIRVWGDEAPVDLYEAMNRGHDGRTRLRPAFNTMPNGRPLVNVLALSGGGSDGAFGAGLLAGWSKHGDRPEFQIVTGISAGALIAPFAFLGPHYDHILRRMWTEFDFAELFVVRDLTGILGGTGAVDAAPLADAIAKHVTPTLLAAIAAAHEKGRYLLVGTTNLDAQRQMIWNMGAIAASQNPGAIDLFRRVILASASIPGLFPPVTIEVDAEGQSYEEMHVDGGTTHGVFVSPFPLPYTAFDRFYPAPPLRRIYVVNNSKISPESEIVTAQTLSIAGRAISTLLKSQHVGELNLIYRRAKESGADFNLAAVPADFVTPSSKPGEPAYERVLFEAGFAFGRNGGPWMSRPPEGRH